MYSPLVHLQATTSTEKILCGHKGRCRFCGTENNELFRQDAHLVPEALGNRRIFSIDECDICNQKFSLYEDSLAAAVGSLLTLGGTAGKGGKVRQTGRSAGDTVLKHERSGGERQLRLIARNVPDYRERVTQEGEHIVIRTPLPQTPFNPLFAYKALVKMAVALVPVASLEKYGNLLHLLQNRDAPVLDGGGAVTLSFGSIGNAPPVVAASLWKRDDDTLLIPEFIFVVCAGSVCLQLVLRGDEYSAVGVVRATSRLQYSVVFGQPGAEVFRIAYDYLHVLDWSSVASQPQPLQEMVLRVHPETTQCEFLPVWR